MYQPRVFHETERSRLHALIEAHPFGMLLVSTPDGEVDVAHVPFVLDPEHGELGGLRVHVARANPIWREALAAGRVTAVFSGPHGYVSPRWYGAPEEHGKFKLGQNRSSPDRARVEAALRERGSSEDLALAALMADKR